MYILEGKGRNTYFLMQSSVRCFSSNHCSAAYWLYWNLIITRQIMWTMSCSYPIIRIDDNWKEGSVTVNDKSMVWTYSYNIQFQAGLTKQVVKKIYCSYLFEGIGIFDRESSSGWFKYSPLCELIGVCVCVCVCWCVLSIQLSDFSAWLNVALKIRRTNIRVGSVMQTAK